MATTREQLERLFHDVEGIKLAKGEDSQEYLDACAKALPRLTELAAAVKLDKITKQVGQLGSGGTFAGAPAGDLWNEAGTGTRTGQGWNTGTVRSTGWGAAVLKSVTGSEEPGMGMKALVPSGSVVVPSLMGGIVRTQDRPRSVLQLIPGTALQGTDQYSFLRETVRTHNAAPVATGAKKPTSVYSVARVDDSVETIAHLSEPIPRQTLADAALLQQYVEGALREGVELEVEDQVVNGNGTSPNLTGLANTTGRQMQAFSSTILTTARKAITKLEVVNITPTAFVLSPGDWEVAELYADSTGDYILGENLPVDRAARRLWGVPVVTSTVLSDGKGFLVDFAGSTHLWEREAVRVDWSEQVYDPNALGTGTGASDFERNMIRFRAEGRWGFGVLRPSGVVEVDTAA